MPRKNFLLFVACTVLAQVSSAAACHVFPDTPLIEKPTLFMPGDIEPKAANSSSPAFAPGFDRVFLTQNETNGKSEIMEAFFRDGKWSSLKTANFSGVYKDIECAYSPDGKYLIFASNRPVGPGDSALDGHYNGVLKKAAGGNLWRVNFSKKGDQAPIRLPLIINSGDAIFSPALTAHGDLFFMHPDSGGKFHIYRSPSNNGSYQTPVRTTFALDQYGDYDPVVAPDESFLIFSSTRPPASKTADIFIVFKVAGGWSDPIDLRKYFGDAVHGIECRLSPDLNVLYYSNTENAEGKNDPSKQFIWKLNISQFLKSHGVK